MNNYTFDLHVHSALSPCADKDMTPCNIANMMKLCDIDIAAITDHNAVANCPAFFEACQAVGVTPVAGIELNTAEEIHVLCLFRTLKAAMDLGEYIRKHLQKIKNKPEIFGEQVIYETGDMIAGHEELMLLAATDISVDDVPALVSDYGGIAIPAHIDRDANSLLSTFGFIPDDYPYSVYEMREPALLQKLTETSPALAGKRILISSDAHTLTDIPDLRKNAQNAAQKNKTKLHIHNITLPTCTAEALIDALSHAR